MQITSTVEHLVRGYLTPCDVQGDCRHVAVAVDGTIYVTTYKHPRSGHYFNRPNWRWEVRDTMPEGCEYCGQYPQDMRVE